MKRGEIYRTAEKVSERGGKPGYYVVVARDFVAENENLATVVCAPIYNSVLGLATEVAVDTADGVARASAIRADFLTLMFKKKLTHFVGTLSRRKVQALGEALKIALAID